MKKAKPLLSSSDEAPGQRRALAFSFTRIHFERFLYTLAGADFSYVAIGLIVYLATQLSAP